MAFFDLYVRSLDGLEAWERLGWKGLCLAVPWEGRKPPGPSMKAPGGLDMSLGLEIGVKRASQVGRAAQEARKHCEVVIVKGSDLEVSRAAVETPEVDILALPPGTGFNHIMARLCSKNNVSVCFSFHDLLYSCRRSRSGVMSGFLEAAKLLRKYGAPFVLASGALSGWDARSPSELVSLGRILGFRDREIKDALSGGIVRENRRRLSGRFIMPGVEVE